MPRAPRKLPFRDSFNRIDDEFFRSRDGGAEPDPFFMQNEAQPPTDDTSRLLWYGIIAMAVILVIVVLCCWRSSTSQSDFGTRSCEPGIEPEQTWVQYIQETWSTLTTNQKYGVSAGAAFVLWKIWGYLTPEPETIFTPVKKHPYRYIAGAVATAGIAATTYDCMKTGYLSRLWDSIRRSKFGKWVATRDYWGYWTRFRTFCRFEPEKDDGGTSEGATAAHRSFEGIEADQQKPASQAKLSSVSSANAGPSVTLPPTVTPSTWRCLVCELDNALSAEKCEICRYRRGTLYDQAVMTNRNAKADRSQRDTSQRKIDESQRDALLPVRQDRSIHRLENTIKELYSGDTQSPRRTTGLMRTPVRGLRGKPASRHGSRSNSSVRPKPAPPSSSHGHTHRDRDHNRTFRVRPKPRVQPNRGRGQSRPSRAGRQAFLRNLDRSHR